ncbi:M16 family metallopeptidase [Acetivibrio clariflavus]|uniref:Putative Zn-dependent peptidase n=1 Tax=Acetivibrio clariflavus (strain DSM 19732 / NBRC 101661 / EBR45) TaxID=720554 RepID=G8M0J3_ACECE|nr:pitrilysin family protein [Acetivibrio clariflavus]AEV68038.1 putative Zn-dependent peptidase [Acetivibrio clariflavus DSM 19732]
MINRITLENGVRIICEKIPHVRSVSVGIWVGAGSRNEKKEINGISHFIEHMLFKGTKKRSAKEIAESIDSIGGQINAFTGKECTCYYTKTLDTHIDIAIDVLADMFFNSVFSAKDIDIERKVVLEEISMYEDSPEDLVHDYLSETVWENDAIGMPILGTYESLHNIERDTIVKYISEHYLPENTVIAVAGNFDDNVLIDIVKKNFGSWYSDRKPVKQFEKAEFKVNNKIKQKDIEQVHICLGFEGIEHGNDDLYSLLALNNVFGGGMSSRLFQKIREERGLVYSIYSYPSSYCNAGLFTIYAGMNPEHKDTFFKLVMEEIEILIKHGISEEELAKSKEQLKGSYILGLESTSSRMNSLGKSELMLGKVYTPEEVLKKIDAVNNEKVREIIEKVFQMNKMSIAVVGNINQNIDLSKYI